MATVGRLSQPEDPNDGSPTKSTSSSSQSLASHTIRGQRWMQTWSTSSEHAPTAMIVPTIACCVDDSPNEHLAAECTLIVHLIRCPSFRFGLLTTSRRHSAVLFVIPATPTMVSPHHWFAPTVGTHRKRPHLATPRANCNTRTTYTGARGTLNGMKVGNRGGTKTAAPHGGQLAHARMRAASHGSNWSTSGPDARVVATVPSLWLAVDAAPAPLATGTGSVAGDVRGRFRSWAAMAARWDAEMVGTRV